jgi:diguanylate cyclase (GGDEF)-like protein
MLDIDRFKQINDTYGHTNGDEAIRFLARSVRNTVRSVDVIARFGGDEFVILLPETTIAHAAQIAERLRSLVAGNVLAVNEAQIRLSLSLGVAGASSGAEVEKIDVLLDRADLALYAAKQAGRNQVQVYGEIVG